MTKSDNAEDGTLSLILANGSYPSGNNVFTNDSIAAPGSGDGSTNLYLRLLTNIIPDSISNMNQTNAEVGYGGYVAGGLAITRDTNNWDRLSAGLWANGNTANFSFATNTLGTPTLEGWALTHSNGNVYYSGPLSDSDPQPFTSEDDTVTNAFTVIAHGHSSNDAVVLVSLPNVTMPSGVTSNTIYYVNLSNGASEGALPDQVDFLRLATTAGGAPIDVGSGAGLIAGMNQQTLAVNNQPRFVTNALRITED